jgi:hypothetical protein
MDEVKMKVVLFDAPLHRLQPVVDQDLAQPEEGDIDRPGKIDLHVFVSIILTKPVFLKVAKGTEDRGNNNDLFEVPLQLIYLILNKCLGDERLILIGIRGREDKEGFILQACL